MTDVGFTGGGNGAGMVYLAGKQSHKMTNDQMIDHIDNFERGEPSNVVGEF